MSRRFLFLAIFCFARIGFAEVAKMKLFVPQEIFELVESDFSIKNFDETAEFYDVEVTLRSPKGTEQKWKVGYTQEVLDLSHYVDKVWEHFQIQFQSPFPLDGSTSLYFVSRYKSIDVGSQKLGLGCGKALVFKTQIGHFFDTKGFELMTKAGSFLNLLGGDYLLVHKQDSKIKMVYFRVRDGRWSHRLCAQ